jgi:hypothetical protein
MLQQYLGANKRSPWKILIDSKLHRPVQFEFDDMAPSIPKMDGAHETSK